MNENAQIPPQEKSFFERSSQAIKNSLTVKLLTIGILILLLLIPLEMIQNLIREREGRKFQAINEVSNL